MTSAHSRPDLAAARPLEARGWFAGRLAREPAEKLTIIDPASETPAVTLWEDGPEAVAMAVERAAETFAAGTWSRASVAERAGVLRRAGDLIRERAETIAAKDARTTGLSTSRVLSRQARAAADWFGYFAALAETQHEEVFRQAGALALVTREPVGVVALFTPWNIPVMGASLKLAAALSLGNSCVLKPSEQSPLGALDLAEALAEAGLPAGALHVVNGRGPVTGAALARDSRVGAISFTGGETAGRQIARAAMERFAKVTLELGGKSAIIVFDDADCERALDAAVHGAFSNSGQACLAGSRVLVHKAISDRFIADFCARAEALPIGGPFDPTVIIGPLATAAQLLRMREFVSMTPTEGGEVLTGGGSPPSFSAGFYVQPTAALFRSPSARPAQEEAFAPFASLFVFDDEDEAVRIANDTRFGLAGYVWSRSYTRALRVARGLRAGYVMVNGEMMRERNAPFGGMAHSGIDREGGRWSLDFYSEAKTTLLAGY